MLVEIADSRCPPASGVLLTTGCASTLTTPGPAGLARPHPSIASRPWARSVGCETSQTLPQRNRSTGSPAVRAHAGLVATKSRTERHKAQRVALRQPIARVGGIRNACSRSHAKKFIALPRSLLICSNGPGVCATPRTNSDRQRRSRSLFCNATGRRYSYPGKGSVSCPGRQALAPPPRNVSRTRTDAAVASRRPGRQAQPCS